MLNKTEYNIQKYWLAFLVFLTFKKEKLLEIDYQLNRWKYPEMFWFCEPEYFENMQGYYRIGNISDERLKFLRKAMCKYDFIFPAINILRSRTTEKERFYYRRNLKS